MIVEVEVVELNEVELNVVDELELVVVMVQVAEGHKVRIELETPPATKERVYALFPNFVP
jgi:hypothetical protein